MSQPSRQRLSVVDGGANRVAEPEGYRLLERLGDGAEGGAWRAEARESGVQVVAKPVEASAAPAVRRALETLRQAGSANLPAPRALVSATDGRLWLITAWVPGRPLGPGPVPVDAALRDAAAVARGLAALHELGTHHGDVSPGNVVVDGEQRTLVDLAQLGRRGTGTPGFLAPETLGGGGGPAADRFALGCLLAWRLGGEPLWRRPEALLSVRSRADVIARVRALGLGEVPRSVLDLLVRLLDPDPEMRPASTRAVARRLSDLARHDRDAVAGRLRWWPPTRWPYVGASVDTAVEGLAADTARLVVVAGPRGAGRDRVVEDIVLRLQARGVVAVRRDGHEWASGAASGSWLEAWASAEPNEVTGVVMPPLRSTVVGRVRAALLLARGSVVLTADEETGRALEGTDRVVVVWPRPLSTAEATRLVTAGVDGADDDVAAVVTTLQEASGGWAPAIVRALGACARADARVDQVASVAGSSADRDGFDDPALSLSVLRAAWTGPDPSLPVSLAPGGRPHRIACAQARASLGAHRVREAARQCGGRSLAWAIDAEDDAALSDALVMVKPGHPDLMRAVESVAERDVAAPVLARLATLLLGRGDAKRAEALAARVCDDPQCRFARARALQRLGRAADAAGLLVASPDDPAELVWSKRGLRWRLHVDAGESELAVRDADASGVDAVPLEGAAAVGVASALLWAAYASALTGDLARADQRLQRVMLWAQTRDDAEAAAVQARVLQLHGNLAHGRGALEDAADAFDRAAAAFERAGEPVGGLTLRGTACALSVLTLEVDAGVEHGRAALRGFLAQGQTSALVEAALNLVQLLVRCGAIEEVQAIAGAVEAAVGEGQGAVVDARRARLRADVLAATRSPSAAQRARIAVAYAEAAAALERCERPDEARDAWLRAAVFSATPARADAARRVLSRARTLVPELEADAAASASWGAVAMLVAARIDDPDLVPLALDAMRQAGTTSTWLDAHRVDLAVLFDRALLAATRMLGQPASRRHAIARRLLSTLNLVMDKTRPHDRQAVRASLVAEGGDARALRELLEDLEAPPAASPAASPVPVAAPAPDDDRYARLLRMYRRFAREDRLEPLLEQVVDAVMELTDAERGAVVVRRPGGDDLSVTRELSEGSEGASYSRSVIATVLDSGEPVLSVDAAADERFDDSRSISHLNLRSVLAVPLRFRGELLGAAYVDHRLRRGNFGEDDLAHMEAFGDLAALAVAHAAALTDLEEKTEALTASSRQLSELLEQREAEVLALREDARRGVAPASGYRGIIGGSSAMQAVFRLVDRVSDADVPVVIYGESGTGKELVARALHDAGGRAGGPFVAENCGAIPETLLESVLFGHAKGAFTGAQKAKPGLFEAADSGTIFLDEVSEMSMPMQTKLLRVLQEGEVRRVGETQPRAVNVRVLAASNRDLEAMVAEGSFRRDLFYRINVVRVDLPPLRDRPEDIGPLIEHFFARHGATPLRLAPSVLRALRSYAWPGNVRQLENEVQRWIALSEGAVGIEDLSPAIVGTETPEAIDPDDLRIRPRVDRLERGLIARALEKTRNNQTQAAQLLGLSRYGLQKKLKRMEADEHQS